MFKPSMTIIRVTPSTILTYDALSKQNRAKKLLSDIFSGITIINRETVECPPYLRGVRCRHQHR